MDTVTRCRRLPLFPLGVISVKQTRIPCKRYGYGTSVHEVKVNMRHLRSSAPGIGAGSPDRNGPGGAARTVLPAESPTAPRAPALDSNTSPKKARGAGAPHTNFQS